VPLEWADVRALSAHRVPGRGADLPGGTTRGCADMRLPMRAACGGLDAMTWQGSLRKLPLASLVVCLAAGCGSVTPLSPDGGAAGGGATGTAGHAQAGGGGSSSSGAAGKTGSAGATGAAGAAGTTGAAGVTGTAGAGGHGGAGGTGVMCGPVCAIFCQYGNVLDANGCATCQCNPAPACTPTECGGPPPYAQPMCTGPIAPAACTRGADGKCAWHPPSCVMCAALGCNPMCPNGVALDASGCPTCQCSTCPAGSHAVSCPQVRCNLACADGFVHDTSGCATCTCRQPASCAPPGVACISCPFGYRTGPNNCRTCACEDPPAGCLANATGPAAP
jgi:hypothetical protein